MRQRYSPVVIDHWQNPRNFWKMENPDGYARMKGSCGDSMEMFVKLKGDEITECTFFVDGCGTTTTCGSMMTNLAKHKSFMQALAAISSRHIFEQLGGLPEEDIYCARLAAETLRRALADCLHKKKPQIRGE